VSFLTEEEFSLKFCPLTGLPVKGRVTLETVHGGYILYKFQPIGIAYFEHASLKSLGDLYSAGSYQPLTNWAGLCREAYELDQKVPIVQGEPEDDHRIIPETFEDKQHHFLRLFYEAGGKEHRKRNIFLNDDFPMAFAQNAEEFSRIFQSLLEEDFLRYDKPSIQADAVDGRLAHFRGVLLTPTGKQEAKNLLAEHMNNMLSQKVAQRQPPDVNDQIRSLLNHIYNDSPEHQVKDLLAVRDYATAQTDNANEFEQIVDEAHAKGWLTCGKKAIISLGRIQYRDVRLTPAGIEEIMPPSIDKFKAISTCPITGLRLHERATFKPLDGSDEVLYTFKPIGCAIFLRNDLLGLLKAIEDGSYPLPNINLAGLCREAEERNQPVVCVTDKMIYQLEGDFPITFEDKQLHLLRLLYETGGREHKKRNIFTYDDFPLAFAKDAKELTEVVDSLLDEGWLTCTNYDEDPNMWPGGIRVNYYGVLLTREGKNKAKTSSIASATISIPPSQITVNTQHPSVPSLSALHPIVQSAAVSLFASGHYRQAIFETCIALDNAVQNKAQLPSTTTGTALMTKAFSANMPLVKLSENPVEQQGFMNLYQGLVQAIRNYYGHNRPEQPDPIRALEWLSFISALFFKLEETLPAGPAPSS
jgi:hypothetical protein